MPFDGSGTFTRVTGWVADATAGIKIRADRHDLQDDDFTNGLSLTITRDGQTQPTNDIPLNGHRVVNVGDPVNDGDVATKGWLARTPYQVAGSDVLGRIKFQGTEADAPAGKPLGFEWAQSDMFYGVRKKPATQPPLPAPEVPAKWVWNNKADASGTDVMQLDKTNGLLTVARAGVTLLIERPPVSHHTFGAYLTDDQSAWRYRTTNKAMLFQSSLGTGDGGQLYIFGDQSGAAAVAKDGTIAWDLRFAFYRRGGMVIYGSENTYNLLITRPELTAMGSIHNTAGYTGWAQIDYEWSSTYFSYSQFYQAGVAYWGTYTNSPNYSSSSWQVSDARVKDKIADVDHDRSIDIIKGIPAISYESRADRVAGQHTAEAVPIRRHHGWRAQDVRKFLPDAVVEMPIPDADMLHRATMQGLNRIPEHESKEGKSLKAAPITMLAMNDRAMVATLWAAMQRLIDRVEQLEAA